MLPRHTSEFFVRLDSNSANGYSQNTIEDIYVRAANIKLHDGVPEDIRSHFATALNLIAYSWYFYPFNVTAQLMAYISVEFALKKRFPENQNLRFKGLVKKAVKEGLINDKGFTIHTEQDIPNLQSEPQLTQIDPTLNEYARGLTESIPYLRNELAHGSSNLHNQGASSVRMCADFINQLFAPIEAQ